MVLVAIAEIEAGQERGEIAERGAARVKAIGEGFGQRNEEHARDMQPEPSRRKGRGKAGPDQRPAALQGAAGLVEVGGTADDGSKPLMPMQ